MRLSGEPHCDPNQSSAPPVIDYNRLTLGEAKETHPMVLDRFLTRTNLKGVVGGAGQGVQIPPGKLQVAIGFFKNTCTDPL